MSCGVGKIGFLINTKNEMAATVGQIFCIGK
jgi:hypothetical protein